MALEELKRLTRELQDLAQLLKGETRPHARWIIMRRIHEIMFVIGEGMKG